MLKFSTLLLSCVFISSAFAQTQHSDKDKVIVAQVGDRKITLQNFNERFNDAKKQSINAPTKEQFLEDLVRYEVGVLEAEKRQLEKDPIVQDRFKQELYKALLEKDLGQKVQNIPVNENEMQAWYKKNPELRISHILIELKYGATPEQKAEARKRATVIFDEVKKSKRPFEELVKIYSDDPLTKPLGGDLGWITKVTVIPSIYDNAQAMKQNEVRGILESPFGLHIIKLTGRRTYENANKRQIRLAVFEDKKIKEFNQYFEKLKKSYSIKTNPGAIQ